MDVRVVSDPDGVAELASAAVARRLTEAAGEGRVTLGLAGGGTPRTTYLRLRDEEAPWPLVDAWLGDERWVPPDHPDSNGRMAAEALLDHVPATLHRIPWDLGDPEAAAAAYERSLADLMPRPPDVVLLGMGDDGHTASLFPGSPVLAENRRRYVASFVADKDDWRLTATLPLLWSARKIIFLVTGAPKAAAVAAVVRDAQPLPARLVADGAEDVTWYLDEAAASELG